MSREAVYQRAKELLKQGVGVPEVVEATMLTQREVELLLSEVLSEKDYPQKS